MTSEEKRKKFIDKARKKYGDKYDYSMVEYKSCKEKVCIICPIHGKFYQTPMVHLNSMHGCPECGKLKSGEKNKSNVYDFVEKAKKIHGYKYDYSKVEYKDWNTKVCIICPEHGEFWQTPISHIAKHQHCGCPECGKISSKMHVLEKIPEYKLNFIKKATEKYNGKYDYSNINYVNSHTPIKLVCEEHGEFEIEPYKHLQGQECPICKKTIKHTLSCEEKTKIFIDKAKTIHGDKYDYSKTKYIDSNTSVCIICPVHGEFYQKPKNHLNSVGCWKCYNESQKIYTYEYCYEVAKKYKTHMDFRRFDNKVYYHAKLKNWINDYIWLENIESNLRTQLIYVYEFPNNFAYVGLTCNVKTRDYQHKYYNEKYHNNDSVLNYSIENNVEIPEIKILEEGLTRIESKEREQYWADYYKSIGYELINKCKCGSLGGNIKKEISNEEIVLEAKKYKNQEEFCNKNRSLYNYMVKRNLKKECFPNTKFVTLAIKNDYTDDFILSVVTKYETKNELRLNNFTVYHWLWKHNKLYNYFDKNSGKKIF